MSKHAPTSEEELTHRRDVGSTNCFSVLDQSVTDNDCHQGNDKNSQVGTHKAQHNQIFIQGNPTKHKITGGFNTFCYEP